MINEKDIQDRVNRRLSGLAASQQRRMRIRTALSAEREEAQPMKRTISRTLVFAVVAVMLMATVAIAEHFNLFNFFGEQDERYNAVAPHATLTVTEPALVEHPELGTATASIDSAYFDGLSLNLAYRITQGQKVEEYAPTETELARMTAGDANVLVADFSENEPGIEILRAWNQAVESGTPYGYKRTSVYTSDHTITDDGIDLFPDSASPAYSMNGEFCASICQGVFHHKTHFSLPQEFHKLIASANTDKKWRSLRYLIEGNAIMRYNVSRVVISFESAGGTHHDRHGTARCSTGVRRVLAEPW